MYLHFKLFKFVWCTYVTMKLAIFIGILAAVDCMPHPKPGFGVPAASIPTDTNGQGSVQPDASASDSGQVTVSKTETNYSEKEEQSADHQADEFNHDDGRGHSVSGASEKNSTSYQSEKEKETNKQSISVGPSGGVKATEDTESENEKNTKNSESGRNSYKEESGGGTDHNRSYESGSQYSNATDTHDKTNKKEHSEWSLGPDLQSDSKQSQSVTEEHDKTESAQGSDFQKEQTEDRNGNTVSRRKSQSNNNYHKENAESSRLQSNSSQTSNNGGNQNGGANSEGGSNINDDSDANSGTNQNANGGSGGNNNVKSDGESGNINIGASASGDGNGGQGNGQNGNLEEGNDLNVGSNTGTNGDKFQGGPNDDDSDDGFHAATGEGSGSRQDTNADVEVGEESNTGFYQGVNAGAKQEGNVEAEANSDENAAASQEANAEADASAGANQGVNAGANATADVAAGAGAGANAGATAAANAAAGASVEANAGANAAANAGAEASAGANAEANAVAKAGAEASAGANAGANAATDASSGVDANEGAGVNSEANIGAGGASAENNVRQKQRFRRHIMKLLDREERNLGLAKYDQNVEDTEEEVHKMADLEKFRKEYLLSVAQNIHNSKIVTDKHGRPRVVSPHHHSDESEYLFGLTPHNKYGHKYGHSPISSHYANVQYIEDRFGDLPSLFGSKKIQLKTNIDNLISKDKKGDNTIKRGQSIELSNIFDNDGRSFIDKDSLFNKVSHKYEGNSAIDLQLSPKEWISRFKKDVEHKNHHFGKNRAVNNQGRAIKLVKIDPIVRDAILSRNLADILKTAKTPEEVRMAMTTIADGKERDQQKNQMINKQQNDAPKVYAKDVISQKNINTSYARNANDIFNHMIEEKPNFDIAETSYDQAKELIKQVKPGEIDFTRDIFGATVVPGQVLENNIDNTQYVTYESFPKNSEVKGEISDSFEGFTTGVTTEKVFTIQTPKTEYVNYFSNKNGSEESIRGNSTEDSELEFNRKRYNASTFIESTTETSKTRSAGGLRFNTSTESNVTASDVENNELKNSNEFLSRYENSTKIYDDTSETRSNINFDETMDDTELNFGSTTLTENADWKTNYNKNIFEKFDTGTEENADTTTRSSQNDSYYGYINDFENINEAKSTKFNDSLTENEEYPTYTHNNKSNVTSEIIEPRKATFSNVKGNIEVTTEFDTVIQKPIYLNNQTDNGSERNYYNTNDFNISNIDDLNTSYNQSALFEDTPATDKPRIETKNEGVENIFVNTEAYFQANSSSENKMIEQKFTKTDNEISTTQMPNSNETSMTTKTASQEPENFGEITMLSNTTRTTLNPNKTDKVIDTELSSSERLYARSAITVGEDDDFDLNVNTTYNNSENQTNKSEDIKENISELTAASNYTREINNTNIYTEANYFNMNNNSKSNQSNTYQSTLTNANNTSQNRAITTKDIFDTVTVSNKNDETNIGSNQDKKSVKDNNNSIQQSSVSTGIKNVNNMNSKPENNIEESNTANKQAELEKPEVNLHTIKSPDFSFSDSQTEDYPYKQTVKRGLILDEGMPKSEENDTWSFNYSYTSEPNAANPPNVNLDNQSTTERMGDGYSTTESINMSKPDISTEFTVPPSVSIAEISVQLTTESEKHTEASSENSVTPVTVPIEITAEKSIDVTSENPIEGTVENNIDYTTEPLRQIMSGESTESIYDKVIEATSEKSIKVEKNTTVKSERSVGSEIQNATEISSENEVVPGKNTDFDNETSIQVTPDNSTKVVIVDDVTSDPSKNTGLSEVSSEKLVRITTDSSGKLSEKYSEAKFGTKTGISSKTPVDGRIEKKSESATEIIRQAKSDKMTVASEMTTDKLTEVPTRKSMNLTTEKYFELTTESNAEIMAEIPKQRLEAVTETMTKEIPEDTSINSSKTTIDKSTQGTPEISTEIRLKNSTEADIDVNTDLKSETSTDKNLNMSQTTEVAVIASQVTTKINNETVQTIGVSQATSEISATVTNEKNNENVTEIALRARSEVLIVPTDVYSNQATHSEEVLVETTENSINATVENYIDETNKIFDNSIKTTTEKNSEPNQIAKSDESIISTSEKPVEASTGKKIDTKPVITDSSRKISTEINTAINNLADTLRETIEKPMVGTSEKSIEIAIEKDAEPKTAIVRRARSEELSEMPDKTQATYDKPAAVVESPTQSVNIEGKHRTIVEPIKSQTITSSTEKPKTTIKSKTPSTKKPKTVKKSEATSTKTSKTTVNSKTSPTNKPKATENSLVKVDRFLEALESDKAKKESKSEIEESVSKSEDSAVSSSSEQSRYIFTSNLESDNLDYSEEKQ